MYYFWGGRGLTDTRTTPLKYWSGYCTFYYYTRVVVVGDFCTKLYYVLQGDEVDWDMSNWLISEVEVRQAELAELCRPHPLLRRFILTETVSYDEFKVRRVGKRSRSQEVTKSSG